MEPKLTIVDKTITAYNDQTVRVTLSAKYKDCYLPDMPRTFIASTTLKGEDKFDYNKGKAIALAKAERKVYKAWLKEIEEKRKFCLSFLEETDNFVNKAKYIIDHDTEYIKKLSE